VKPTSRVQAHEAEVNAVAFAPHNENILITGSADKVSPASPFSSMTEHELISIVILSARLSHYGISVTSNLNSTPSNPTPTKSSRSPGHP